MLEHFGHRALRRQRWTARRQVNNHVTVQACYDKRAMEGVT